MSPYEKLAAEFEKKAQWMASCAASAPTPRDRVQLQARSYAWNDAAEDLRRVIAEEKKMADTTMSDTQHVFKLIHFLGRLTFRPMTGNDFRAFGGVESADPMIAEQDDITVILDGSVVILVDGEGSEHHVRLSAGVVDNSAVFDKVLAGFPWNVEKLSGPDTAPDAPPTPVCDTCDGLGWVYAVGFRNIPCPECGNPYDYPDPAPPRNPCKPLIRR